MSTLALWKRWRCGDGELSDDTAMFAAALAALNLTGATLSALWLVLPHARHAHEGVVLAATLAAYTLGAVLVTAPRAKPWWMLQLSIALDTLVISVAVVATGDAESVYAFYYLWATLYAACFFNRRQIVLQGAWVGVAYAAALALTGDRPPAELISQWLLPMATLLAAGTLVRRLTGRLTRLGAQARHAAEHDPLTGLANRARFAAELDEALAGDRPAAVVFIDLDNFKRVNDSLGHTVGDALLVAVAERLRAHAGPSTALARFGGDEFLAAISSPFWEMSAQRLLDAFATPFAVGDSEFAVTASLGIAVARPGENAQTVLCHADAALYHAKRDGRARLAVFDDSMRAAVAERLRLENDLRAALQRDELDVAYQPIVSLGDGTLVAAEALARWTHPELGPIAPEVFVSIAEESGLIDLLGERVLTAATRTAAAWVAEVPGFHRICVNVSPRQLQSAGLLLQLDRALRDSGLAPHQLVLEVTESTALADDARTRANLDGIAAAGIGLALDDFGTGQSSLSHLCRLRLDAIKLDRRFVATAPAPLVDAIVTAVAGIGRAGRVMVLAEGIETADDQERMRRLGCRFGQGWHFGCPMPADALTARLRAQAPDSSISPSAVARATASSRELTPSLR